MRFHPILLTALGLTAGVFGGMPTAQAAPPAGWEVVFQDEFSSDHLDPWKWGTEMAFAGTHGPRYHNEYYVSYTVDEDVITSGGLLRLRTDRRTVEGSEGPGRFDFTQGLVSSHDRFAFRYGYVEVRAKFPGGKGLWPCFWLMPENQSWPAEFDVAEYYGGQKKMHFGLAYGSMHNPQWDSTGDTETNYENEWHTFGFEWTKGRAVWSIDGVVRKVITADYVPDEPMYILLSNSVSSVRGPSGFPDAATVFPNFFEIDYVRVYQPASPPTTILVKGDMPAEEIAPAEAADASQ